MRFPVVYEGDGLHAGFMTYIVRSLLSEGRIWYETVVKENGKLQAQLIEREGPTGLLVTTTAVLLHPENETRMLSILVNDTPAQTRHILQAIARKTGGAVDPTRWQALQTWLERAEHRVIIPYAEKLADKLPPVAVRLRRDFGAVLNLIEAHAILHQATSGRDAQGCIVATLEDYTVVRELVGNLVSEGVGAAVPPRLAKRWKLCRRSLRKATRRLPFRRWRACWDSTRVRLSAV
jgi:hypothetical protein